MESTIFPIFRFLGTTGYFMCQLRCLHRFIPKPPEGSPSVNYPCKNAFVIARSHAKWCFFKILSIFLAILNFIGSNATLKIVIFCCFWSKEYLFYQGSIFSFPVDPDELPVSSEISSPRSVQKRQNRVQKGVQSDFLVHHDFWQFLGQEGSLFC